MNINQIITGSKGWIEEISAKEVFEDKITGWIKEYKRGSLTEEDVLKVTKQVAEYRKSPLLMEEIKQRLN